MKINRRVLGQVLPKPGGKLPAKAKNVGGRPRSFDKLKAHERLREMVAARQDSMTAAQISAAEGVKYLVARDKKGGKFRHLTEEGAKAILSGEDKENEIVEEWEKLPSTQAFAYLMDQTIGKPANVVEADVTLTVKGIEERIRAAVARTDGKR